MSLHDWLKKGWLVEHNPSREEVGDLFGVADRDLEASQTPGLNPDWRLNIADYERAGVVSEQEAAEMIDLALELRRSIEAWLRRNHPALV